ncbi:MAG: ATP-binding protein [Chloroflexota bacterium]
MWINRNIEKLIREYIQQFSVLILTGARQTGKTSLFQHLFPDFDYVSLDDPFEADRAEYAPREFLDSYTKPLIIDEVQYAPSIFRYIKLVVDQENRSSKSLTPQACQYLLTGSQSFDLMKNVSESLAGRAGILSLPTLSASEVQQASTDFELTDFVLRGGYPVLYSQENLTPRNWFPSYISTYLERDVRNTVNVQNLRDFSRFIRALAIRTSQVLSYADIARDVGVAPNTIKSWISIVQASNLIYLLEPYYRNIGQRLVKSPKIYFTDTGLLLHLLGINRWEVLIQSPLAGAVWETYCFSQIHKAFLNHGIINPSFWYWRTQDGHEVDFVIEKGTSLIAMESKLKERPSQKDTRGFHHLHQYYGEGALLERVILCNTKGRTKWSDDVLIDNGLNIADLILD